MAEHPYIAIDEAAHVDLVAAVAAHEQSCAAANAKLVEDLDGVDDLFERAAIIAAFDAEIAPVRVAFEEAVASAEVAREKAQKSPKTVAALEVFVAEEQATAGGKKR